MSPFLFVQDFLHPEPDPWSVCLPLPIAGFLKTCLHERHKKKDNRLYDKIDKGLIMNANSDPDVSHKKHSYNIGQSDSKIMKPLFGKEKGSHSHKFYSNYGTNSFENYEHIVKSESDFKISSSNASHFSNKQNSSKAIDYSSSNTEQTLGSLAYSKNYGQYGDDDSELSTDEDYTYNDYEGDQSEIESDNDDEKLLQDQHCYIL